MGDGLLALVHAGVGPAHREEDFSLKSRLTRELYFDLVLGQSGGGPVEQLVDRRIVFDADRTAREPLSFRLEVGVGLPQQVILEKGLDGPANGRFLEGLVLGLLGPYLLGD